MVFKSGFGSNAKMVLYRLPDAEGEEQLYSLTPRMVKALLSNTDYLSWKTRHSVLPPDLAEQNALDKWVADLNLKLMTPIETTMDCNALIECITSNPDTKQALIDMLLGDAEFAQKINNAIRELSGGEITTNLGSKAAGLDLNVLWAECVQVVEYTHDSVVDLLQILEVQFNNIEFLTFVEMIPMVGTIFDETQADVFLDFVNYMQELTLELYDAQWTETIPTGLKWVIACKLFCLCKPDGIITIDRINTAYATLLAPYGSFSLDNLSELIETLLGINDNSSIVPLLMHSFTWAFASLTSIFGLEHVTTSALKIVLKLADNDANNDWTELCAECPDDATCLDLKTYTAFVGIVSSRGVFVSGKGIQSFQSTVDGQWRFSLNIFQSMGLVDIAKITLSWDEPVTDIELRKGTTVIGTYNGAPTKYMEFTGVGPNWPTTSSPPTPNLNVAAAGTQNVIGKKVALYRICYEHTLP